MISELRKLSGRFPTHTHTHTHKDPKTQHKREFIESMEKVRAKYPSSGVSQAAVLVKNLPANAGDARHVGSILGSGRSPGGGHGNPLQYSCLKNPMDRGAWQATVHSVTQGQTQLKRLSLHTHTPVQSGGYPPHRSHCACWS